MAQQVVIAGAMFEDVPSISVPDANNVYHPFLDTTIASNAAAASDIAQGKLAYVNGSLVTGTNSGGGGGGLEYESGTWSPSSNIARGDISFSKTHTSIPIMILLADTVGDYSTATYTNFMFGFLNWYTAFGKSIPCTSSAVRYASVVYVYRGSGSSTSNSHLQLSALTNGTTSSIDYYVSTSGFKPYTGSTNRYWRSDRTYKWIAVWAPTS